MVAKRLAVFLERSVQSQQLKVGVNLFSLFLMIFQLDRFPSMCALHTLLYDLPNGALKASSS